MVFLYHDTRILKRCELIKQIFGVNNVWNLLHVIVLQSQPCSQPTIFSFLFFIRSLHARIKSREKRKPALAFFFFRVRKQRGCKQSSFFLEKNFITFVSRLRWARKNSTKYAYHRFSVQFQFTPSLFFLSLKSFP